MKQLYLALAIAALSTTSAFAQTYLTNEDNSLDRLRAQQRAINSAALDRGIGDMNADHRAAMDRTAAQHAAGEIAAELRDQAAFASRQQQIELNAINQTLQFQRR